MSTPYDPPRAPAGPSASDRPAGDDLDPLIGYTAGRDVPCPGCGYNLRGMAGDRCPECGDRIRLSIALAEPRLALFVSGVVGLSMGLGFCALLTFWALLSHVVTTYGPPLREVVPLLVGLILNGLALAAWVMHRTRVRQLPAFKRRALAAGTWVLTGVIAAWFMIGVAVH